MTISKKPSPKAHPLPPDDKAQSQRFVETARELGVDESGETFECALGVLTPAKPGADPVHPSSERSSA